MKILMVITCLGRGGADRQVIEIAKHINKTSSHSIKIVSILPLGSMGMDGLNQGLDIVSLNVERGQVNLLAIIKLVKIIIKYKPSIIHSHMKHAIILSRVCNFLLLKKYRLIDTFHNICSEQESLKKLINSSGFLSHTITFVSKASADSYISQKVVKGGVVIGNALIDIYSPEGNHRPLNGKYKIAALGRLHIVKNYNLLLRSFSLFHKINPYSELIIAGHGDNKDLMCLVKELQLTDSVTFLGPVRNINKFFLGVDLYISTSKTEGFSLSLAEAILCNKIFVSTDSGGVNDIVSSSDFIAKEHNPDCVSHLMQKAYLLNDSEIIRITQNNRKYILDNFSIEIIVNKLLGVYNG